MRNQNEPPRREKASRAPSRSNRGRREDQAPESRRACVDTEPDLRAAVIVAREKALAQEEELLRYKCKAWLLEQKLAAQLTGRRHPTRERHPQDADVEEYIPQSSYKSPSDAEAIADPRYDSSNDEFPSGDFCLDDASPPKALKALRSRVQLPTRETMRSTRTPRPR
jgi:hypothetical protein